MFQIVDLSQLMVNHLAMKKLTDGSLHSKICFNNVRYLALFVIAGAMVSCAQHALDRQGDGKLVSAAGGDLGRSYSSTPLIRVSYEPGELKTLCDKAISKFSDRLEREVKNAFDLDRVYAEVTDETTPLSFMGYVNQNEKVRAEGSQCEEKYNRALIDMFTRKNLYEVVVATPTQNPDEDRIVSEFKRNFEKNGMTLSGPDLTEYREMKSELVGVEAQFTKNLNEDTTTIELTESELTGMPAAFISRLKKAADGRYIVTTKITDYLQVMENAKSGETRRKMHSARENIAAKGNTLLLEKAVVLREKIAKKLGYKVWADYRIKGNMANNSNQVNAFLVDLKQKMKPRLVSDLAILLEAKKKLEDANAKELKAWDIRYFENQVKKTDYSLDEEVVRDYLPKETVMAGLFEVYSTLLSVKFEEIKDARVWGPEVKLYSIRDRESKQIVGYFYTDFMPREGKYGHAAAFPIILGRLLKNGSYVQPVSAIVANFTPPANGRPSLLTHDELETVFHEFGHIMHQTLTRAPFGFLSGSAVAQDFVEAPSQMLENWVWDPMILKKVSGLYSDPKQKMPDDLIAKIVATRDFNKGYFYSRQLSLGLTDMAMHTATGPVDVNETYKRIHKDVMTFSVIDGSHFCAGFGHLMGGYDAGYYGYIWSEVFAADMFTAFQKEGLLNSTTGEKYRATILEQGDMLDAIDILAEFLDRQPNNEAFLKKLKIK